MGAAGRDEFAGLGRRVGVGVALGAAVVIGLVVWGDARELARTLSPFRGWVMGPVIGLSLLGYLLRWLRWELYLARLGVQLGRRDSGLVFGSGLVMSITPGKIGEVFKSFLLRRSHGVRVARTAPIVVAERLTDLLAVMLLASFGVAASGYGVGVMVAGLALATTIIALAAWGPAARRFVARLPLIGGVAGSVEEAQRSMRALVAPGALLGSLVLGVGAWGCEAIGTWLVLEAFPGVDVAAGRATFVYAFATVAGALSMLPGGLAATEGTMIGLLDGVFELVPSRQIATAVTLLIRFATLWLGVALGAVALGLWRRDRRRAAARGEGDAVEAG